MVRVQLVVDDPSTRLTLRAMLVAEGCEIVDREPEVLIADTPAMAVERARSVPALLLAKALEIRDAVAAMRHGVFGYIFVPFQPGEAGIMVERARQWGLLATGHAVINKEPTAERLEDAEAELILAALRRCKNNQAQTARQLGIGRNTLWRKLKKIRERTNAQRFV